MLVRLIAEPAGAAEIVIQPSPLLPEHAAGRGDRSAHLHRRLKLGDLDRIPRLQNDVRGRRRIAQRARQVHVDPAEVVQAPDEANPLWIGLARQPAGPRDQVRQPIRLGAQRIRARVAHLAHDDHRALKVELRLPQNQHVVVGLERDLRCAARRERRPRRAHVATQRVAVVQIRRVEGHAHRRRQLALRTVLRQPRDLRFLQIGAHGWPPRQRHELAQGYPGPPRIRPRLPHHPRDRDVVALAQRRQKIHHDGVAIHQRHRGNQHRIFSSPLPTPRRQLHVDHRPRRGPRPPLRQRQDAVHGDPLQRRVGREFSGCPNQLAQSLTGLQLVNRRPAHRPGDLHPRTVHRHEYHVTGLQPDVAARVAAQQVVVQVHRRHGLAEAAHLYRTHVRALGQPAGRVQRRQHRAERADLVGAWLTDLAHHVHLVGAHVGDRNIEPRRGVGLPHTGVHSAQARKQHVAQLVERQVRDEHLPDLRNENESLASHLQLVGQLDVAGENQYQLIGGAELVVGGHGTREQRQELRRRAPEHIHPEHRARRRNPAHDQSRVHRQEVRWSGRQPQGLHRR